MLHVISNINKQAMDDELRPGILKSCDVPILKHLTCARDTSLMLDASSQVNEPQKGWGREKGTNSICFMHLI